MVSLGKVLYAAATILPVTQQIVGLGKMGHGLYKLCTTPKIESGTVNKLFGSVKTKQNHKKEGWTHLKQGAVLFIPIIGTIFAIYMLIVSKKGPEKNSEVKIPEETPIKDEVKKVIKKPSPEPILSLKDQPFTSNNLLEQFQELIRNIPTKGAKKQIREKKESLVNEFAQKVNEAGLLQNLKDITIGLRKENQISRDCGAATTLRNAVIRNIENK